MILAELIAIETCPVRMYHLAQLVMITSMQHRFNRVYLITQIDKMGSVSATEIVFLLSDIKANT